MLEIVLVPFVGFEVGLIWGFHNPGMLSLRRVSTNSLLQHTLYSSMSKTTLQLASHIIRDEMRDACVRPGTICASITSCKSHGISRLLYGLTG